MSAPKDALVVSARAMVGRCSDAALALIHACNEASEALAKESVNEALGAMAEQQEALARVNDAFAAARTLLVSASRTGVAR